MAQAVSRRLITSESRGQFQASRCEIFGGQSGTGTGFTPSTSVFPCLYHSTGANKIKVNQSHYRPEVPRGFQEVKVPRLRDNGQEWW